LSDAQFTLSIVYKVMVASVSIIMALLFLIAGGGLHYKLVILGKAKGGNSNWKVRVTTRLSAPRMVGC
jgi:hypothetical protein